MTGASRCFGIDLGTTCSAIGVVEDGTPRILPVDGEKLVPSVVGFPEGEPPLVGRAALNRLALDPERTIRSAKRHMGSDHAWVVGERTLRAPDVAALVLGKLADGAERALGERPRRAVVTVPAWFTQAQRADTRAAAEQAGIEAVRLLNEPTAAALAHAHTSDARRRALVYDLGGGTFDASLVEQDGSVVEVRASHGDTRLGGDDLDRALAEALLARIERRDPALAQAVRAGAGAMARLALAAQEAKHELSASLRAGVRVPFLLEQGGASRHLEDELAREELERLALPLIERTLASVEQVLSDARVRPREVDELLLVGGSTRIPLVWHLLRERYGWEGSAAVPPDEAVVLGAAIQAALVDGSRVKEILLDVTPYSLSVAALEGRTGFYMTQVLTPRNAPLPARHAALFHTADKRQDRLEIPVLQGSDPNPLRNTILGKIVMEGLPRAPKGMERRPIGVQLQQDLDGMVSIRVTDELSGRSEQARIAADGLEAAELREDLVANLLRDALVPGDGSDPDPFLLQEESDGGLREVELEPLPRPAPGAEIDEAEGAFVALLAREHELESEHPERARELRDLARSGLEAVRAGDSETALARYDELSDLLFELGVYL